MNSRPAPLEIGAFIALVGGAFAMGASPIFVRFAEIGPFASAFWRVALALPVLGLWWAWERRTGRAGSFSKAVLLAGLFFAGDLMFWHLAVLGTTIANATLLACLAPVWVALFSGAFIGEPVSRTVFYGLGLCLIGAAMLVGESFAFAPERLGGDLAGFVTSLFFGFYFLAVRVARRRSGAAAVTFQSTSITAILLMAAALVAGGELWPQAPTAIAALFALGLLSHAGGQGLLAIALGVLSASFSSLVIFIEALAAAVLAWAIFSEALSLLQIAGGAFILFGIWVARPKSGNNTSNKAAR